MHHYALDFFAIGKRVKHGGEYWLEIPASFDFYGPEKAIKLGKKQNKKGQRKLNETVKHFLK